MGGAGGTGSPSSLCALAKRRAPPEGLLPAARLSSAAELSSVTVNGSERNTLGLDANARANEPCSRKAATLMPRWKEWYTQKTCMSEELGSGDTCNHWCIGHTRWELKAPWCTFDMSSAYYDMV